MNHPERERTNELKPEGSLPAEPPEDFTKLQKKWYRWFLKHCPPDVATAWDLPYVLALVRLFAKEAEGTIKTAERTQMIALGAKFGMTPSDRAKIAVDAKPKDRLAEFLKKKPGPPLPAHLAN
ncbi:MAG: P27 family phage terminase small subunit [Acidobacteriia bacterium]|nr:P27 family phage terminase small subunit [Terriglobia bacterium]